LIFFPRNRSCRFNFSDSRPKKTGGWSNRSTGSVFAARIGRANRLGKGRTHALGQGGRDS
jgi:hypothetical protein